MAAPVIRAPTPEDLDQLGALFDAYRIFYGQASDPVLAKTFLRERLEKKDSVIFVAETAGRLLGFTQLYPSFSSIRARPAFILNDLFVAEEGRRRGIASSLLAAAVEHGRERGAARLTLSTALDNMKAQALYERQSWSRDERFCVYNLSLD